MGRLIKFFVRVLPHRHRATGEQFIRFCFVGAFNTGLDLSVYLLLTRFTAFWSTRMVAAAVVSFGCGAVSSFLLNNFWTFERDADGWRRRLPKFLIVALGGAAWNALIISALLHAGVYDVIAKVTATACVLAWNFTFQKKWTFRA